MAPTTRKRKERSDTVAACLRCQLCNKFLIHATKSIECFHTFCRKCIFDKITKGDLNCCPVCEVYLGENPLEKLRPDLILQDIRNSIIPIGREKEALELLPSILYPATGEAIRKTKDLQGSSSSRNNLKVSIKNVEQDKEVPTDSPKCEAVFGIDSIKPQAFFYEDIVKPLLIPIKFNLTASEDQENEEASLPQIASRYVAPRDENVTVSYFQRFIARKLGLTNELEVEIICQGQLVPPTTVTAKLIGLSRRAKLSPPANVERLEDDGLVILNYCRKLPSP